VRSVGSDAAAVSELALTPAPKKSRARTSATPLGAHAPPALAVAAALGAPRVAERPAVGEADADTLDERDGVTLSPVVGETEAEALPVAERERVGVTLRPVVGDGLVEAPYVCEAL